MANIQISQLSDGGALQDVDQIPIVRGTSNYKITGNQIAKNSALDDIKNNLIFNSEFYDTRNQATITGTTSKYWNGDGSIIFWSTNPASLFYGSIFIENGERIARLRVDDNITLQSLFGRNIYFDEAKTISLRGKTLTVSSWVRLGTNWNTTNGQGALRLRAGYTTTQGLVGDVNNDLTLKQVLGATSFIGSSNTGTNPPRNEWIQLTHTFTVPANAFNLIFTYDGFVVSGDQLVANKLGDIGSPQTFYFDVKQPQLTISTGLLLYKPTGYIEANATNTIFATTSIAGISQLSDNTKALAGVNNTEIMTPSTTHSILRDVRLSQVTATNQTSIVINNLPSTGYSSLELDVTNLVMQNNIVDLFLDFSINNGTTWLTAGYYKAFQGLRSDNGNTATDNTDNGAGAFIGDNGGGNQIGNQSGASFQAYLRMKNFNSTTLFKNISMQGTYWGDGGDRLVTFDCSISNTTLSVVNALRFRASTGNIVTGIFTLIGVK